MDSPALHSLARAMDMERRYRAGETLQQVGDRYKITRERVRQILAKRGVKWVDGGAHVLALRAKANRRARLDAIYIRRHGCTFDQFWSVNPRAWSVRADRYRTPIGAYFSQRRNAKERGIAWEFQNFWQWWSVWEQSGRWPERGRSKTNYVMSRIGDAGAYAPGNVQIVSQSENVNSYYDRERATYGRVRSGQERKAA